MMDKSNNSNDCVNVLSLFDGMSCGMLAMMKAGLNVGEYYAYETDKYAIQTSQHNFPQIKQCGDVFNGDYTKYKDIDYLIGGSPCFTSGNYVLTDKGYVDVADIQVGDLVLTHKNRYKPVIRINERISKICNVNAMGYPTFRTTSEHPFYTIERRKATYSEYKQHGSWRLFSNQPKWTKAESLTTNHFVGMHIRQMIRNDSMDVELAYILGRYVSDGHLRKTKRKGRKNSYQYQVVLSIGAEKVEQFKSRIKKTHFSCYPHTHSVYRCVFSSQQLLNFIQEQGFGEGAINKNIPEMMFLQPPEVQQAFIDGYIDGDGCFVKIDKKYSMSTVSPKLAFCLQRMLTALWQTNVSVSVSNNNRIHTIQGREIKANYPIYTICAKRDMRKQTVAHIQDSIMWTQIKSIKQTEEYDTVYNIEVADDNSYTVNNCIVHNCTFWSIAQSPDKRETTASGIGWELFSQYVRALHEAKPKYFIYENNKSMAKAIYESISETFGFEPICINSALVSAQNRQRLYWVGKRNDDGTYSKVDIEQPQDMGILLRDVLDGMTDREKGRAVIGSTGRTTEREYFKKNQGNMSFEPVGTTKDGKSYCLTQGYANGSGENIGNYVVHTLEKGCKSMVAEPVNATPDGKSQTIKAQYSHTDVNNICKYVSTYVASGVAERVNEYHVRHNSNIVINNDGIRCARNDKKKSSAQETVVKFISSKTNALIAAHIPQVIEPIYEPVDKSIRVGIYPTSDGRMLNSQGMRIYSIDGKSVTQSAQGGGMGAKTGLYAIPIAKELTDNEIDYMFRKEGRCDYGYIQKLDDNHTKAKCLTANISKGVPYNYLFQKFAEPIDFDGDIPIKAISYADGKTYKVYEVKDGQITIKEKQYPIKLRDGYYIIRKLTVSECKRLQTVPECYDFPVSDTQAYKMLGNGWTVDVIAHLIKATR